MRSPTDRSHDAIEELIAADALDGLDEVGRRELLRMRSLHGADCAVCLRLEADYAEVASELAMSLHPIALSPGATERLLRQVQDVPPVGLSPDKEPLPSNVRPMASREGAAGRVRRWMAVAAVAAAVALVGGGLVGYSLAPRGTNSQQLVAFLAQPGARVVNFIPSGSQQLAVALHAGDHRVWVLGSHLDTPASGKVYELWFLPASGGRMQPAGTFEPNGGTVLAPATVNGPVQTLAVTVEPRGGSLQPTTSPIFMTNV